ncbi:MAG: GEVED domain-containing protein [Flavobacteriales bacterium]
MNSRTKTGYLRSTLLWVALSPLFTAAQTLVPAHSAGCGFDRVHEQRLLTDPRYAHRTQVFEGLVLAPGEDWTRGSGPFVVPVVVHIMSDGTALTELSDDQVRSAIEALNQRFRNVPGTIGDGSGVDLGVEFALAARDPNGNCTNGITRYDLSGNPDYAQYGVADGGNGISDFDLKDLDRWDPLRYYNIWVVSEIDDNNGGSGTQGYAYFASAHGEPYDGMVVLANSLKDHTSIVLTHELGHALNLFHTFEGDNDGTSCPPNADCTTDGDRVCDTPPHIRSPSTCPAGGTNACDGGSSNTLFVYNYMDYSSCSDGFTSGQAARTAPALTVQRASLLAVNGNLSLVPPSGSAPIMDIHSSSTLLCGVGQEVAFYDYSTCIPNTFLGNTAFPGITFNWTVTNGVVTYTSTDHNPTFTLGQTGVYNATLAITTANGTFSRTEQGIVLVAAAPASACTPTTDNAGNYAQTVNNVSFNTIDNSTSTVTNTDYTDFSCSHNTVVAVGGTYALSIALRAGGTDAETVNAYIDYNNNGVFEDPSELVLSGSQPVNSSGTVNANVTIPGGAVTNTLLRLRVYGETGPLSASGRNCAEPLFVGDVEDYGVYISNSTAAVSIAASPGSTITYGTLVTFTPTPVNGGAAPGYTWFRNGVVVGSGTTYQASDLLPGESIHCEMASNLTGVIGSPALSNTISMTVTGPPLSDFTASQLFGCAGSSLTFTDVSLLSPTSWSWSFPGGTPSTSNAQNPVVVYAAPGTYTVTLIASNGSGTGTTATYTDLITISAVPPAACSVTRSNTPVAGIGITNVTLGAIDNDSPYDGAVMNDYACVAIATLEPSTNYPITVRVGSANSQWVRVYIDYDNSGTFSAGELVFAPANGTGLRSGNFTTPASPTTGSLLRMRVITDFVNTTPGACTSPLQYGQVEEYTVYFDVPSEVEVALRVHLDGPYQPTTGLMNDALRTNSLIPTIEPYSALGYAYVGGGTTTIQPAVLAVSGSNAIVDWVVVELRSTATPAAVIASKPALLQRDGDVVNVDGVSPVSFDVSPGNYHVAIRHRNHLGCMTLGGVALTSTPTTVDFTSGATNTWGSDARKMVLGSFPTNALWPGDVSFDHEVLYTGGGNDRDIILQAIGGSVATNIVPGYLPADVNLDGQAIYTGGGNDRDIILQTIGGVIPTSSRTEQIP